MNAQIISPQQAAELYGVSVNTIYSLISLGRIPAFKVGSKLRMRTTVLAEALEKGPMRRQRRLRVAK